MTEDDTFKALKRIPIQNMIQKYQRLDDFIWNHMTDEQAEQFFADYGWTEREFRIGWQEYLNEINP